MNVSKKQSVFLEWSPLIAFGLFFGGVCLGFLGAYMDFELGGIEEEGFWSIGKYLALIGIGMAITAIPMLMWFGLRWKDKDEL